MRNLIIGVLAFGVLVLALLLLLGERKSAPRVRTLTEVRYRSDTVVIVRKVPERRIVYRAIPRIDTVRIGTQVGFALEHDTLTPSGDSVRIIATYPPPSLSVYFRTAPVADTTQISGSVLQRILRDTIVVEPNTYERYLWATGGIVAGLLLAKIVR